MLCAAKSRVHAGVAAADVICCIALGKHAIGEDHHEARDLLVPAARDRRTRHD
jgi:hypothetical protein